MLENCLSHRKCVEWKDLIKETHTFFLFLDRLSCLLSFLSHLGGGFRQSLLAPLEKLDSTIRTQRTAARAWCGRAGREGRRSTLPAGFAGALSVKEQGFWAWGDRRPLVCG